MLNHKIVFMVVCSLVTMVAFFAWPEKTQGDSQFKNVQVLTDLSPDELEDMMAMFTESLGVEKCTFCHVKDKASDENEHKVIARKYLKMTRELRETYFKDVEEKDKVTCYTCHRGEAKPSNSIEQTEERAKKKAEEKQ